MSWWKEIEQLSTVTPIFTHHLLCSLSLGLFLSFIQDLDCKQNEARTGCCDISWCRHQQTDLGLDLQPKLLELLLQFKKGLLIPGAPKVVLECHDKMGSVLLRKSLLILPTFNYLDLSCFDGMDYLIFIWAFRKSRSQQCQHNQKACICYGMKAVTQALCKFTLVWDGYCEWSRVELPTVNTIQAAAAMGSCRRNLLTCSRHLETYLLFGFCGIRTPDSLQIVLQILNDKKHTRKLQKIDRRPDKQLNRLTIL